MVVVNPARNNSCGQVGPQVAFSELPTAKTTHTVQYSTRYALTLPMAISPRSKSRIMPSMVNRMPNAVRPSPISASGCDH